MTIVRINRRGNSLGVNIPKSYLGELAWGVGVCLFVQIKDGALIFRPVRDKDWQPYSRTDIPPEAFHGTQQD